LHSAGAGARCFRRRVDPLSVHAHVHCMPTPLDSAPGWSYTAAFTLFSTWNWSLFSMTSVSQSNRAFTRDWSSLQHCANDFI
jgi:hypothetical protein